MGRRDAKQEDQSLREEAVRLKTLAQKKFNSSDLTSALKYADRAHRICPAVDGVLEMVTAFRILRAANSDSNWYEILGLESFSHINSIRNQYKKLALVLHPDKSSLDASEEAFKLVNDAFHVLSDRTRRKEYDMKLRVAIQAAAAASAEEEPNEVARHTFWTECSRCQLLHRFDRKYVGHSLVCPSCRKSFKAVEVSPDEDSGSARSSRSKGFSSSGTKRKMNGGDEVLQGSDPSLRSAVGREKPKTVNGRSKAIEQSPEEEMTLAEMRVKLKKKSKVTKKAKINEERKEMEERVLLLKSGDMDVMKVEDSDFYDFDRDRVERSFKQGQVWALYDDDDGMPRHYGLIEEVVSVNPFEVKMSWLDLQNNGDKSLICWEKMGFHVSCGRFKVSKKDAVNMVNVFSHMVKCERVARELYRIYPHKGSVWALYSEEELEIEGRNCSAQESRHYKIVLFLTSYTEMYGVSMAYLNKVDGFRTVFKRIETGHNAIRWIEKYDFRRFSHQIPAREFCGDEVPNHLKNCWELDPAALPPDLLAVTPV